MRVRIEPAESEPEIAAARELFIEYASALRIDLGFQDFEVEVAALPGRYAPPDGRLLLAWCDEEVAGCAALRRLSLTWRR